MLLAISTARAMMAAAVVQLCHGTFSVQSCTDVCHHTADQADALAERGPGRA